MEKHNQIKSSDWLIKGYSKEELAEMKTKAIEEANNELKEKKIEEMARDLGSAWLIDLEGNPHDLSEVLMECDIKNIAEHLTCLGYTKQVQSEWKVVTLPRGLRRICEITHKVICKNCGFDIEMLEGKRYKYCPNCGAKMFKENEK